MAKNINKNKKDKKRNDQGWEALEKMLQERGLTSPELEEARKSFYDGIEVLSKMFMLCEHDVHKLKTSVSLDSSAPTGPQNDSDRNTLYEVV